MSNQPHPCLTEDVQRDTLFLLINQPINHMYRVHLTHYAYNHESVSAAMSFADALHLAKETAQDIDHRHWTRHARINEAIQHLDNYSDLYNEGSIIIRKSDEGAK